MISEMAVSRATGKLLLTEFVTTLLTWSRGCLSTTVRQRVSCVTHTSADNTCVKTPASTQALDGWWMATILVYEMTGDVKVAHGT